MARKTDIAQVKLRLPEPLRQRLESEAEEKKTSLNGVIVDRLQASAGSDRARLLDMLDLVYGRAVAGFMLLFGEIALELADSARPPGSERGSTAHFLTDPYAFDQLRQALTAALVNLVPAGEPTRALGTTAAATWPEWEKELLERMGRDAARYVISDLRSPIRRQRSERLEAIADRLATALASKETNDAR